MPWLADNTGSYEPFLAVDACVDWRWEGVWWL